MKIGKRKAVFRVEFDVYHCGPDAFKSMCEYLRFQLEMMKEVAMEYPVVDQGGMDALAKIRNVRRLAR